MRPLPGDELVADANGRWNHAVTIRARPAEIWPWLVQMGCRRAGWYSYDGLDNGGVRSAARIVPELQQGQGRRRLPDEARGRRHIRRPDGRAGAGTRARRRSSSTSPRAPSAGSTPAGRQLKDARRKPGGIAGRSPPTPHSARTDAHTNHSQEAHQLALTPSNTPVAASDAARASRLAHNNSAIRRLSTRPTAAALDNRQRTCDEQGLGTSPRISA